MIRHCVFHNVPQDHDSAELTRTLEGLAALRETPDDVSGFIAGPNRDFERKSQAHPVGFTVDFAGSIALATYAEHPEQKALGARLVAQRVRGMDVGIVFDPTVPVC